MALRIETFAEGRGVRILGGALEGPVQGKDLESAFRKAAVAVGVVESADELAISSTYEAAQVLESLLGDEPQEPRQIVSGIA